MVYAQADKRWAGADLTVISLELLTVFVAGPLALYICYGITKRDPMVAFWMIVLATGEIYGGFMTFCPEYLSRFLAFGAWEYILTRWDPSAAFRTFFKNESTNSAVDGLRETKT